MGVAFDSGREPTRCGSLTFEKTLAVWTFLRYPFVNAVYRRWTARKGWREKDPERGLFILEEDRSVPPHLSAHLVYVELCADGLQHSLTEDLT